MNESYQNKACNCVHCLKRIGIIHQIGEVETPWQPICIKCLDDLQEKAWKYQELG